MKKFVFGFMLVFIAASLVITGCDSSPTCTSISKKMYDEFSQTDRDDFVEQEGLTKEQWLAIAIPFCEDGADVYRALTDEEIKCVDEADPLTLSAFGDCYAGDDIL